MQYLTIAAALSALLAPALAAPVASASTSDGYVWSVSKFQFSRGQSEYDYSFTVSGPQDGKTPGFTATCTSAQSCQRVATPPSRRSWLRSESSRRAMTVSRACLCARPTPISKGAFTPRLAITTRLVSTSLWGRTRAPNSSSIRPTLPPSAKRLFLRRTTVICLSVKRESVLSTNSWGSTCGA